MPFGKYVNQLKAKWEEIERQIPGQNSQQSQQYPGQQNQYPGQQQAPPPPPDSTRPGVVTTSAAPQGQDNVGIYWRPDMNPGLQVSQEWEHKLGNNNGWGNNELQNYTDNPQNSFYTNDGKLVLRALSQPNNQDPGAKYTSARLVSRQRLSRNRGCLTAWITSPCAGGIWPAFWLLPFEPFKWPNDGEVDIGETWNGDQTNHSCLHWGFFSPEDNWKHRVVDTNIPDMATGRPVRFDFVWEQDPNGWHGRMVWFIDGRPVMRFGIPEGLRPLRDFNIVLNIAMGGNVTAGKLPTEGYYDFVVHGIQMSDDFEHGGWNNFTPIFDSTPEGHHY